MGESKTLILIDGHALAFREYYALESLWGDAELTAYEGE